MKILNVQWLFLTLLLITSASCKKEYEYEYNTYITNENVYTNSYYLDNQVETITDDIRPEYLKQGDSVAIFAISNSVTEDVMRKGIQTLESWGLKVAKAENLYSVDGRYAGTQADRIVGLQKLIDNPNIKAIIAARGGYGATQVLPFLDFKKFDLNPKWMVGFSDLTAFHALLNNKAIESIHGAMANNLSDETSVETLHKALFGELKSHTFTTNNNCVEGTAEGRLVGGNLSLIYSLGGTLYDLNVRDAILLIEDVGEKTYHIERMIINLKLSGKLDCIRGVIVGDFSNMTLAQAGDKTVEEIMKEQLTPLGIPVLYGANIGHGTKNIATYLGRKVKLEVGSSSATLTYE